jgi:hypothetical protein
VRLHGRLPESSGDHAARRQVVAKPAQNRDGGHSTFRTARIVSVVTRAECINDDPRSNPQVSVRDQQRPEAGSEGAKGVAIQWMKGNRVLG